MFQTKRLNSNSNSNSNSKSNSKSETPPILGKYSPSISLGKALKYTIAISNVI